MVMKEAYRNASAKSYVDHVEIRFDLQGFFWDDLSPYIQNTTRKQIVLVKSVL